jgi:hypothetical protein
LSARNSFLLRLDPKMLAALKKWAADELRSVNAQIEYALRLALAEAERLPDAEDTDEAKQRNEP